MISVTPTRRLLLSIHDVSPRFLPQIERLDTHLACHAKTDRVALLVVPDHWGEAPIARDPAFQRWLRRRHAAGAEIILHGWSHRDDGAAYRRLADRMRAGVMTAGEGEFLALPHAEALRRMREGRDLVEQIIGGEIAGFVAPAWLYGPGAHAALAEADFAFAEDHLRVWRPATGEVLARGPVVTWASRSRARLLSSLAAAAVARLVLPLSSTIRIAVHPGDTGALSLMDSIRATVRHFCRTHTPDRYAALLPAMAHRGLRPPSADRS